MICKELREVSVLQSQVVDGCVADGPRICQCYFAIAEQQILIEDSLGIVRGKDLLGLVEQETAPELMFSEVVIEISLDIMLSVKDRADDCQRSDWDCLSIDCDRVC